MQQQRRPNGNFAPFKPWSTILGEEQLPTFTATEDFEGTERLLREEIAEGWQKPKGELE